MLKSEIEEAKAQILSISGVNPKSCMICGKCLSAAKLQRYVDGRRL